MKQAYQFNLLNYKKYKEFIEFCKNKIYSKDIVLHEHHIIPKHLWFDMDKSVDNKDNLIQLSVEDHINAHLLLAECYESDTYQHISNLRSARILDKKSIKDKKLLDKISKTYLGSNNPFYGKQHSENVKKTLSEKTKLQCDGVSYKQRYGDRAELEKMKRSEGVRNSWSKMTDAQIEQRKLNISLALKQNSCKGENVGTAQPYLVDGVAFGCRKDVERFYGNAFVTIKKRCKIEKITKEKYKQYKYGSNNS